MTLEPSAPAGRAGPPGEGHSEAPAYAAPGVWTPPPAGSILKSRTWHRGSAAVVTRGAGEGYFRGEQHLIFLPLNDYGDATIQIDGGAVERVPTAEPHI